MEHADDLDRLGGFDQVGDAIMSVEQNADVSIWLLPVAVPRFWKFSKDLDFPVDGLDVRAAAEGLSRAM